ncbi:hypothetical protein NGM37_27740, partial [Streptomyces sp. TRM76130]|nr:hypothetical protein [Streptomyces sp. TRM76130]
MSKSIQTIIKDLLGDMADSGKDAFDDLLDRDGTSGLGRSGATAETLTGLPAGALGALVNPLAPAGGAHHPLAALTGATGAT